MNLALGTVQFGMDYGIARLETRTAETEIRKILELAYSRGMRLLDTATSYGSSEKILGQSGVSGWRIVTKLPAVPDGENPETWIRKEVGASLERLGLSSVYGLLLHEPGQLGGPCGNQIYSVLVALREEGIISKFGVSIYDPAELDTYLKIGSLDIVQAPLNLVDRRLVTSGWLDRLVSAGVEVHARSVFLQGLLLMEDAERPEKFNRWSSLWQAFSEWLDETGLSRLQACLAFVQSFSGIEQAIVGVNNAVQLEAILDAANVQSVMFPDILSSDDPLLVNPLGWLKI